MTVEDQIAAISVRQFYTDLRVKLGIILAALVAQGCTVEGSLITTVAGVVVSAAPTGGNVHLSVGQNATGEPIYQWVAPITWVTT